MDSEDVGEHGLAGGYLEVASWAGDQNGGSWRKAGRRRLEISTWGKVAGGPRKDIVGRLAMLVSGVDVC